MGSGGRMIRYITRKLKDTAGIWTLFFLLIFLYYTLHSFRPEFADAEDALDLHRAMLSRTWPAFKGYQYRTANERTHPNDPLLLHRIETSQRTIRTPLLKIKKNGIVQDRHPWKFEKIIHQTWKTEDIPGQTADWVKKWLKVNPNWTHMFWTDASSKEFIKEYYPSLLAVYDSWTIPVQRADMIRLLVLYTFGGVYADLDVEPLRPMDELRDWSSCILSREPDLQTYVMINDLNVWANNWTFTCNAFMACRSHHPFLHYLVGRISSLSPLVARRPCHLEATIICTGPLFVSLGYGYYLRSVTEDVRLLRQETNVICPKYEYFLPTFDSTRLEDLKRNCGGFRWFLTEKQKDTCEIWKERGFKNEPMVYSFTNHHWFHSYHFNVSKTHVNIHDVARTLMWKHGEEENDFDVSMTGL